MLQQNQLNCIKQAKCSRLCEVDFVCLLTWAHLMEVGGLQTVIAQRLVSHFAMSDASFLRH